MRVRVKVDARRGGEVEIATNGSGVVLMLSGGLFVSRIELPIEQAKRVRAILDEAIAEAEREGAPTRPTRPK